MLPGNLPAAGMTIDSVRDPGSDQGRQRLATSGSIWVGSLELDEAGEITGLNGPARTDQRMARVLVRVHGAPVGFVTVSAAPAGTLTTRAREAAATALADSLQCHSERHDLANGRGHGTDWAASVACPRLFPAHGDLGMTVVICSRDRPDVLRDCLRSVQQARYPALEILVVDNAPADDRTRELVDELARDDPRVRYTCEPRPGLSRARNYGLKQARYDLVAFTDDDTIVDPGWPAALAAGFASDPGAVCVTGFVAAGNLDTGSERYFDSRYWWARVGEPRQYDLTSHRPPSRLYPFAAGMLGTGANFAVRRRSVTAIGGFDPLLGAGAPGRGGEDLDMFVRLILAGGRICYLPAAFVWHRHRSNPQALGEQAYSYGHGLGAYLAKHLSNPELRAGLAGHGLAHFGRLLGRVRRAVRASKLGPSGGRVALTEAYGVIVGLLSYPRAVRRADEHEDAPASV